jgi:hypothetical protein
MFALHNHKPAATEGNNYKHRFSNNIAPIGIVTNAYAGEPSSGRNELMKE